MSHAKLIKTGRTTALAAYRRDVSVLRAVAALEGRIPADVLRDALAAWLEAQPEEVRSVARAVESRLAREQAS